MTITKLNDLMAVKGDNGGEVLGKLLYFSISSILIEKSELTDICNSLGIPYSSGARICAGDAFRSATGDIYQRMVDGTDIFKVYCRDNEKSPEVISRELIKETPQMRIILAPDQNDIRRPAAGASRGEWSATPPHVPHPDKQLPLPKVRAAIILWRRALEGGGTWGRVTDPPPVRCAAPADALSFLVGHQK